MFILKVIKNCLKFYCLKKIVIEKKKYLEIAAERFLNVKLLK